MTVIEVVVEEPLWLRTLPEAAAFAGVAAKAALAGRRAGEVAVLLAGDAAVQALNRRFRGRDAATNVLSFPSAEGSTADLGPPLDRHLGPHLGDVALAFGVCHREAQAQGKRLQDHLSHLIVHGVLHLIGYDHEDGGEAEDMEALERSVLAGLGVADPYAEGR